MPPLWYNNYGDIVYHQMLIENGINKVILLGACLQVVKLLGICYIFSNFTEVIRIKTNQLKWEKIPLFGFCCCTQNY